MVVIELEPEEATRGGGAGGRRGRRGGGAPLVFSGARGDGRRRGQRGGVEGCGRRGGLRGRAHRRAAARGSAMTAPHPYCISPHGCRLRCSNLGFNCLVLELGWIDCLIRA